MVHVAIRMPDAADPHFPGPYGPVHNGNVDVPG